MIPRFLLVCLAIACASCAVTPQFHTRRASYTRSPQEVKWFHSGWYVGATVGSASANTSASDIDHALADRGYNTSTTLDKRDIGWKIFGGYRFQAPWAIELAIVDLGLLESRIENDAADVDAFVADVSDVHPYVGAGASLSAIYYPIRRERYDVGLKGGLWLWDAEVETVAATGENIEINEDGFDPLLGLVGTFDLGGNFNARLEWEHYWLGDNEVDLIALGVQYNVR